MARMTSSSQRAIMQRCFALLVLLMLLALAFIASLADAADTNATTSRPRAASPANTTPSSSSISAATDSSTGEDDSSTDGGSFTISSSTSSNSTSNAASGNSTSNAASGNSSSSRARRSPVPAPPPVIPTYGCNVDFSALSNGNLTSLSACSGASPAGDACCSPLLSWQRDFATREPMFFLALTTQPELNTPCRKSLQAHLQASPVRPRITANVFALCNPPANASSSSSSSRRSLLPLVALDPAVNKCPVVWVQDVDRLQNVSRLAKACSSADTACSRCASTMSSAAAALARYNPTEAARTAARGNASTTATETATTLSEAVTDDCARVAFVRVAQGQSWRAAAGLVALQLDCPIV
ncbi:hypothetical protein CLOM_g3387 [Closterium sp. NIES-68]|nr:hypothetical protein CLOM_g3387 [Closterium sp. NIES-68]GJP76531.1 hypothetical protein CLOP_g6962 [Closterium sp. NIES-67]